jgi:hypothetical protein
MVYLASAVERAMKILEVICRALAGMLTWVQAADILGLDPRSVRRWPDTLGVPFLTTQNT